MSVNSSPKKTKTPKIASSSKSKSKNLQYFTESSSSFSDSFEEQTKEAFSALNSDLFTLNNEIFQLKAQTSLLTEQLKHCQSEKNSLILQHSSQKKALELEISELKKSQIQEKQCFEAEKSDLLKSINEVKSKFEEKLETGKKYQEKIKFLKSHYSKIIQEKDNKINHMYLILQQTKSLDQQIKNLLENKPVNTSSTENLKIKQNTHSKSKSYVPKLNDKFKELCKSIITLENEQAEIKNSYSPSPSIKSILKTNESKIKELKNLQEKIMTQEKIL